MKIQIKLTNEQLSDTLCSAFEGGSDYWIVSVRRIEPSAWTFESEPERGEGKHWMFDYPLNPGGGIEIKTEDKEPYMLDEASLKRGLDAIAVQYPRQFAHMLEDDGDADTGDVFLQCCIFGKVIYG